MKNIKGCLLHNSDDWKTPKKLYDPLIELGFLDCFPYKATYNELENNYSHKKLFVNPPFSKLKDVSKWIVKQLDNRNEIILLIPSRTDTTYFHDLLRYNPHIYFFKGRFKFSESKSAPFPTIIMYFNTIPIVNSIFPFYSSVCIEEFIKEIKDEII